MVAPGSVVGVVVGLLSGLLLIFSVVLEWPWYKKLVEVSAEVTPYWVMVDRWARTNLRQPIKTVAGNVAPTPDIQMEQLQRSNSTAA